MTRQDTGKMTRADAKLERRDQLIDATIKSITKHGLSGTTIAKVSEIAGTSVGLVNFHFATKERLLEATLTTLADEQRALWHSRRQGPEESTTNLLLAIIESRFRPAICHRRKLAVWFAFYSDASARETYRRAVGNMDDERLEATSAILSEMIVEAGYTHIDPVETTLSVEAMYDGLWLNMLLYPAEFSRTACRQRALNVVAALLPAHFGPAAKDTQ